jgi:hypothetical protein
MFVQATKNNWRCGTEDRITQVVAACFNKSKIIQKVFLKYLLGKITPGIYCAETQRQFEKDSRPDIIIFKDTVPYIIVESKTSAIEDYAQLKKHQKNNAKKYILITQYSRNIKIPPLWVKKSWCEFANILAQKCKIIPDDNLNYFENKLCIELQNYFKEVGFMKKDCITRQDFENAVKFLDYIRYKEEPYLSINGIGSLNNITDVFEQVLEGLRGNNTFLKLIGMDRKFKSNQNLSYWWNDKQKQETNDLINKILKSSKISSKKEILMVKAMKQQAIAVSIGKIIELKKQKRNGIKGLVLTLRQTLKNDKAYLGIEIWNATNRSFYTCNCWVKNKIPLKTGLPVVEISELALKTWLKHLKKKRIDW